MGGLFKKKPEPEPQPAPPPSRPVRRQGPQRIDLQNIPPEISRILDAVAADQVADLQRLTAEFDVTQLWVGPQTLLHGAAQNGRLEVSRWLLDQGIDADMPTEGSGITPLLYAVRGGHVEVARLLLSRGADVNSAIPATDPRYPLLSALHAAAISGKTEMIRLLLERGADPNVRDGQNLTPLEAGTKVGHQGLAAVFAESHEKVQPVQRAAPRPSASEPAPGKFKYKVSIEVAGFGVNLQPVARPGMELEVMANNDTDARLRGQEIAEELLEQPGVKRELETSLGLNIAGCAVTQVRRLK